MPAAAPIHVVIDGLVASALVRVADLVITDVINEEPNTATLTANLTPHAPDTPPFYPPAFDPGAFVTTPLPTIYPSIRRGQPIESTAAPWRRMRASSPGRLSSCSSSTRATGPRWWRTTSRAPTTRARSIAAR